MSNVVKPRGPKPAAVYWRRRIVVLAVAAGLVLAVARWVGGGDDTSPASTDQEAGSSAEQASSASPSASSSAAPSPDKRQPKQHRKQKSGQDGESARRSAKQRVSTTLQAPRGACAAGEVVVVPDVLDAEAGSAVPLRLGFSTTGERACSLQVSGKDLALEITSGEDLIWQLSGCPAVFERQQLDLRPGWVTYTEVAWNGRRGEDDCADTNALAEPGYYWAEAAMLSGEPARGQFRLTEPPPPPQKQQKQKKQERTDADDEPAGQQGEDKNDRPADEQREDEKKDSSDDQT